MKMDYISGLYPWAHNQKVSEVNRKEIKKKKAWYDKPLTYVNKMIYI